MLTNLESVSLNYLSDGYTYAQLAKAIGEPLEKVHELTKSIRRKTGIVDTKSPRQCRDFLAFRPQTRAIFMKFCTPTERQFEVLRLYVRQYSSRDIALSLGLLPNSITTMIYQACKRIGITELTGEKRRKAVDEYLRGVGKHPTAGMEDPMF